MQSDPGEMKNLAGKVEFKEILLQHRGFLKEFAEKHHDSMALSMLKAVLV